MIRIGEWLADERLDEIQRGDERVKLDRRTMTLLMYLGSRPGEVISTEELLENVWRGVVVAPSSVYQTIAVLRRALQDDAEQPRYIATVQRRGYRLIAPVERLDAVPTVAPVAPSNERAASSGGVGSNARTASKEGTAATVSTATASPRRRLWQVGLTAVALLAVAFLLFQGVIQRRMAAPQGIERTIAVLPFASAGGESADTYLADGLTEGLLQTLGRLPGMRVTARSSVFAFRERHEDVRGIAQKLDVRYLLDGSARREGDNVHIGVQLVDGATGFELWSETYDRPLAEAIRVQEEIARSVARALDLVLTRDVASRMARGVALDPVAIDAYLRGRAYWSERGAASLRNAREHYERAIQRDPRIAAAHVGLAEVLVLLPLYGIERPTEAFPLARAAASRALELDPDLAEAHATLAVVLYQYEWDWKAADAAFRRALDLNPSHATARQWYAEFLSYEGRPEEADAQMAIAHDLDPLSPTIATLLGSPSFWARSYADAERAFSAAIGKYPDFALAHYSLALSRLALGRPEEALAEFETARHELRDEFVSPSLAHALVAAGRRDDAQHLLAPLIAAEQERYVSPYKVAVLLTALGRTDEALARLTQAHRERDDRLVLIAVDPLLDSLRGDARFAELQRQVRGEPD